MDNTIKGLETADFIAQWLGNYLKNAQHKGFVVGVSGGIDSALTSTLCARTLRPVLAVTMPIRQRPQETARGLEHIDWLQARYKNVQRLQIDLDATFDTFMAALPEACRDPHSMANSRARLRMTTLYALATHEQYLVVGTGNKVEDFGVGFFTKYGDGGVDLSPIADLNKSEVYAVAAALELVDSVRQAAPTDGLWEDGRTDEEQLQASYKEIEWAMDFSGERETLTPAQARVLATYQRLNAANTHKFNPIPVCRIPREMRGG